MSGLINITGTKYNKLTVLYKVKAKSKASAYWLCKCDCGQETVVAGCKLKSGSTKSCGCHRKTLFNNRKHGMANKTRTYRTWKEMRQRCLNPNSDKAKWYSKRGITICDRWLTSFEAFLKDMGERPEKKSLDRIDVNGNYEPSNCRWATQKEQMNNTQVQARKRTEVERIKGVKL